MKENEEKIINDYINGRNDLEKDCIINIIDIIKKPISELNDNEVKELVQLIDKINKL